MCRGGFNVRQIRQSPKVKNEEVKKKGSVSCAVALFLIFRILGKDKSYHKPRPNVICLSFSLVETYGPGTRVITYPALEE